MKKILSLLIICALSAFMLAGCNSNNTGVGTNTDSAELTGNDSSTDTQSFSAEGYDKTFEGFLEYMTDNGVIKGEGTELTASAIGAKQGKRFVLSSSNKFSIELYEYEDQTSDIAKKTIANARGDHSFHLMNSTESATANTYAAVTEDGRFLMLLTDNSSNDDPSEVKTYAAKAVESFK